MKLMLSTALAALISTTASADNPDRHDVLRLETGETASARNKEGLDERTLHGQVTFSSRNTGGKGYPYSNPYGVGPNNDSR